MLLSRSQTLAAHNNIDTRRKRSNTAALNMHDVVAPECSTRAAGLGCSPYIRSLAASERSGRWPAVCCSTSHAAEHNEHQEIEAAKLPNQAEQLFNPSDRSEEYVLTLPAKEASFKGGSDLDYLQELLAIQQDDGPKSLGFFGTRNMGLTHQKLVEILSYAMVSAGNHIYTSGATGTNAAVIKGALRADCPDKLTVILPQSLSRQPQESQELLQQVANIVEMPENDGLKLSDASRICNRKITSHVQQVICFAFHDSRLLLETCSDAKDTKKIVTLFYLD